MIKSFVPKPYDGLNRLPDYVTGVREYTLIGKTKNGYIITLGKITVGSSTSAGNPLTHVLYESYDDHGIRRKATRSRTSGYDKEFIAVRTAMNETGVKIFFRRFPALATNFCSPSEVGLKPVISSFLAFLSARPACHKAVIDPS